MAETPPRSPAATSASRAALTQASYNTLKAAGWQQHLLALAFYTALTMLIAWPVIINLGAGTPGHFTVDRNQNLWNFWWFKRSLLETQTNPFVTDFLYYPYGARLYLHTFSPYNLIIGLPLQLLTGLIPAYSLIELLTFPVGGYAAWLLAHYLTGSMWGALLAGLVWSFGPYHWVELRQDQLNLLSLQWLPIFIYFLLRLEQAHTRRAIVLNTLAASGFFLLNLLVDYYYALYLMMFATLYWLWRAGNVVLNRRQRRNWRTPVELTVKWAAAFSLGLLAYSPILLATIRETANPRYVPLDNTSSEQVHSADLLQLFLPPAHQPWWGSQFGLWRALGVSQGDSGANLHNYGAVLGYVAVLLSFYALWKRPGLWFWAANALFWIVISLGPSLRFNGTSTGFPLPYRLLIKLPFVGIGRFPERFILMAQLSFAILAAFGLVQLLQRIPPRPALARRKVWPAGSALALLVLTLFLLESWPGVLAAPDPLPLPAFTAAIKPGLAGLPPLAGNALLELPVTKHSNADSPRMFNQIYHQRPILGGYISRDQVDLYRFGPPAPSPLYDFLDLRGFEPDIVAPHTQEQWQGLLHYQHIGLLALYPSDFESPAALQRAERLLPAVFGADARPYYSDAVARIWAVPPGIGLKEPLLILGWGWYEREKVGDNRYQRWLNLNRAAPGKVVRGEAQVIIAVGPDTPLKASYSLEFEATPYNRARHLEVLLNGQSVGRVLVEGLQNFQLESLRLQPGENVLAFRPDPSDGFDVPAQVAPALSASDTRSLTVAILNIKLSGTS